MVIQAICILYSQWLRLTEKIIIINLRLGLTPIYVDLFPAFVAYLNLPDFIFPEVIGARRAGPLNWDLELAFEEIISSVPYFV